MSRTAASSGIGLYLLLTLLLSAVFWGVIIAAGHLAGAHGLYVTGLMWCPGIAAVLTCRRLGAGPGRLGWRWGAWRWQWLAYLVPLGYGVVAYGIVWGTGLGGFGNAAFEQSVARAMDFPAAPAWLATTGYVVLVATVGMARSLSTALGEEIGWRGFLAPALVAKLGFTGGALATGAIWAAWHMPILLFADYNAGTPWWFAAPCFVVLVLSSSVMLTWLRLRSGSLWTCAVMHASHNLFIQALFTPLTSARGTVTPWAIDEFGFMVPLVMALVAAGFWLRRGALAQAQASAA